MKRYLKSYIIHVLRYKKKHLGPQDRADRGPFARVSKPFLKKLEQNYHQARLGAFKQKSFGVQTIRVKYHTLL